MPADIGGIYVVVAVVVLRALRNLSGLVLGQPSQLFCLFAFPCELRVPQHCGAWGLIVGNGRLARPKLIGSLVNQ